MSADDRGLSARMKWFYGAMGVLALTGSGLLVAALRSPAGEEVATGPYGGRSQSRPPGGQEFPARYDTLGVSLGAEDAPVVVREFADYQCPSCRSFAPTARRLREAYVDPGRVRFVFFDFPIVSQHPNAMPAAQAARCAGRQSAYWPMHDALFERQQEWSGEEDPVARFAEYAREIGIDASSLEECIRSGSTRAQVEASMEFARAIGVRSTPTVVVGNTGLAGVRPWGEIQSMVEAELRRSSAAGASPPRSELR